jgi:2-C-methyl-D-erythritol 2,4-cyclodiphosphate synthase
MNSTRAGIGYDIHRLVEGRRLILGGVEIAFEKGLMGHSDSDVLSHAICDALLGAAAMGDIGTHFPDTDPQWRNASSLDFLRHAVSLIHAAGYRIENVDATIVAERPKLSPHIAAVRERLSTILQIDVGRISVKAKTNEGLDAVGRGEAIACHAVAVIEKDGEMRG